MNARPTADQCFLMMAHAASLRATCKRRKVGAVLVVGGQVVSSGYNGAPRGLPHCLEDGCEMEHGHCVRCVHAEANALIQAGRAGRGTQGATLYTTASPCRHCMMLAINAGVTRVVYAVAYQSPDHGCDAAAWALRAARTVGIEMVHLPVPHLDAAGMLAATSS